MILAANARGERQREVDPRRHAAAGHAVAIEYHALGHRLGAEPGELVARSPVRGGAIAAQQPGGGEQQRSGAHARHPRRPFRDLADPGERFGILHRRDRAEAAGHAQDVGARHLREGGGGVERKLRIGGHRRIRLGHQIKANIAQSRQHLRRAGQVELGDVGIEQEGDVQWLGHGCGSGG